MVASCISDAKILWRRSILRYANKLSTNKIWCMYCKTYLKILIIICFQLKEKVFNLVFSVRCR